MDLIITAKRQNQEKQGNAYAELGVQFMYHVSTLHRVAVPCERNVTKGRGPEPVGGGVTIRYLPTICTNIIYQYLDSIYQAV